jgi:hypothetical protein
MSCQCPPCCRCLPPRLFCCRCCWVFFQTTVNGWGVNNNNMVVEKLWGFEFGGESCAKPEEETTKIRESTGNPCQETREELNSCHDIEITFGRTRVFRSKVLCLTQPLLPAGLALSYSLISFINVLSVGTAMGSNSFAVAGSMGTHTRPV